MRSPNVKCLNCVGYYVAEGQHMKTGECRRHSPTVLIAPTRVVSAGGNAPPQIVSAWAPVPFDAWCTEFLPTEELLVQLKAEQEATNLGMN